LNLSKIFYGAVLRPPATGGWPGRSGQAVGQQHCGFNPPETQSIVDTMRATPDVPSSKLLRRPAQDAIFAAIGLLKHYKKLYGFSLLSRRKCGRHNGIPSSAKYEAQKKTRHCRAAPGWLELPGPARHAQGGYQSPPRAQSGGKSERPVGRWPWDTLPGGALPPRRWPLRRGTSDQSYRLAKPAYCRGVVNG